MAKGIITNYRGSYKTKKKTFQMVVVPEGVAKKEESQKFLGKRVTWTNGKTAISGTATHLHGNKGALRVRFDKGLPGESCGTEVEIKE
jgi:large subunit ribosomal protein L35Ae